MDNPGIIYRAISKTSGKVYVGKTTKTLEKRKYQHLYESRRGCQFKLHRAIRLYGEDDFLWEILETINSGDDLGIREVYWVSLFDSFRNGYNLTLGDEGAPGWKAPDSFKEKCRISSTGRKHSESAKEKVRLFQTGIKRSLETKEKLRLGKIGKKKTPEHIAKMRAASTGKKLSDEAKKKVSDFQRGLKRSDETKKRVSMAVTEHMKNPERRRIVSEAITKYWKEYRENKAKNELLSKESTEQGQ